MMITEKQVSDFLARIMLDETLGSKVNPRDTWEPMNCLYQDGQGNNCLVGYWLKHEVGVDDQWMDLYIESMSADAAIAILKREKVIDGISPYAVEILTNVQQYADEYRTDKDGKRIYTTWADAIRKTIEDEEEGEC
jgi:hypothetical protein